MFVPSLSLDVQSCPPRSVVSVPNRRGSDSIVSDTTICHSKSLETRPYDSLERDYKDNVIRNAKKNIFFACKWLSNRVVLEVVLSSWKEMRRFS